jgi:HK97 family phage major capsid protein
LIFKAPTADAAGLFYCTKTAASNPSIEGLRRHTVTASPEKFKEILVKTISIDAIRQRKVEIEAKIAGVIEANQKLYDTAKGENRDLTADEAGQFDKNTESMKPLKADLGRQDFFLGEIAGKLEREKNMPAVAVREDGRTEAPKAGARRDGFRSWGEQLQAVARAGRGGTPDRRLMLGDFDSQGNFRAAGGSDGSLNEAIPSEGGFLVGADTSEKIYQRTYATGAIVNKCQRQPISASSNRLKLKVVDEDSRADGSRMGGVLAFWQNEADTFLSSRPKFRQIELTLNKLTALVYATDELLEDAAALEAWIMSNLPTEINFRLEDAIFNGTGVGQPLGILNSQALLSLSFGTTLSNVVPSADILAMWSRFWHPGLQASVASIATENLTAGNAGGQPGAAWFIDQTVIPQLFSMTLGSGTAVILLYHPPGYMGLPGQYGQLLGLPVIPTEHNAQLGTVGDIVLADMSQYLVADKGGVEAASSMHVRFVYDEMTFRFTYRADGQTTWKKPLTPKNGGATLSPFLALASGANR